MSHDDKVIKLVDQIRLNMNALCERVTSTQEELKSVKSELAATRAVMANIRESISTINEKMKSDNVTKQDLQGLQIIQAKTSKTSAALVKQVNNMLPELQRVCQWIDFQLQDGSEIVDDFRAEICGTNDVKLLTSGATNSGVYSPYASMIYGNEGPAI